MTIDCRYVLVESSTRESSLEGVLTQQHEMMQVARFAPAMTNQEELGEKQYRTTAKSNRSCNGLLGWAGKALLTHIAAGIGAGVASETPSASCWSNDESCSRSTPRSLQGYSEACLKRVPQKLLIASVTYLV